MKKALFIFFFIQSIAYGSHLATSWLEYKYIGDSTGIQNQYRVSLHVYYTVSGVAMPGTQTIKFNSSCGSFSKTFYRDTIESNENQIHQCAEYFLYGTNQMSLLTLVYTDTVVLTPCANWNITWSDNTVSRLYYDNLLNYPIGPRLYASVTLNNLNTHNSSVVAEDPHPKVFCLNRSYLWHRNLIDSDGDSIYIAPASVMDSSSISPYNINYSVNQPMDVDSTVGYNVNPKTGDIYLRPSQIGLNLLGFSIEEWKFDSTIGWTLKAKHYHETIIAVVANCNFPNMNASLSPLDTIVGSQCDSNKIYIKTTTPFINQTAVLGDFSFLDSNDVPNPILSVKALGNDFYTDSIALTVFYTPQIGANYKIVTRLGPDSNTLLGDCGEEYILYDTTHYVRQTCATFGLAEDGLTANIYPNPANNILNIDFSNNTTFTYQLMDLSGATLFNGQAKNQVQLNISSLKAGYYILMLEQDQEFISKQVLIP